MGEAKRKKHALKGMEQVAEAIRLVVGATTSFHGADCVAYALVGAEVLRGMGFDATAVAGSAAWRVGLGDGDVLSHAVELHAASDTVFAPNHESLAGMFHAWIEVGNDVVDFTTFNFADKARQLDASDGGTTHVAWAPDFLWVSRAKLVPLSAVAQAMRAGVFAYQRNVEIERIVFNTEREFDAKGVASTVNVALETMRMGHAVRVVGLGVDGAQELDDAKAESRAKGFKPVNATLPRGSTKVE